MNELDVINNCLTKDNKLPTAHDIQQFKRIVEAADTVECETLHHFAPGLYVREFRMPAGTVVVGARHRHEHMFMVMKGKLTIWTEKEAEVVEAPYMHKSWAGVQRVLLSHEDSVILNLHPTDLTDLDELRKALIIEEPDSLEEDEQ